MQEPYDEFFEEEHRSWSKDHGGGGDEDWSVTGSGPEIWVILSQVIFTYVC